MAFFASLSIGETDGVIGWLNYANAALAVLSGLIQGCVRITIHSVKVGVSTVMYSDADGDTEPGTGQQH